MPVRELSSPPSTRTLYPRAIASAGRSALRRLPVVGGEKETLPEVELVVPEAEIDREHLAAYDRICGFRVRDELPPTYPHVLVFPLSLALMTDPAFPFPVMGLVHIRNRIDQLRPLRADERLTVRVLPGEMGEHERGTRFDLVSEIEVDGAAAWRSTGTYLHKERGGDGSSGKGGGERPEPPHPTALWNVPGDIGRRYAAVSGDRNPIHLHPVSARLFGMRRPITHGMWLKARCLAALEGSLPNALKVDVQFKLPVFIPGKVNFASWPRDGGRAFAVHDAKNQKPHLSGEVKARVGAAGFEPASSGVKGRRPRPG